MPSNRYKEVAPRVKALAEKYGLHYNTGRLGRQFGTVMKRIAKLSLPGPRRGKRRTAEDAEAARARVLDASTQPVDKPSMAA